jgi:hypothetical protein
LRLEAYVVLFLRHPVDLTVSLTRLGAFLLHLPSVVKIEIVSRVILRGNQRVVRHLRRSLVLHLALNLLIPHPELVTGEDLDAILLVAGRCVELLKTRRGL